MFSKELEQSIANLFDQAQHQNLEYLTIEHLLLMLIADFEVRQALETNDVNLATLRENLIKQLDDFKITKNEIKISKLIIDCIDESGKLANDVNEIEEISNFLFKENEITNCLINIIHKLKPYGVGYRDYKDCIKIQINNKSYLVLKKNF